MSINRLVLAHGGGIKLNYDLLRGIAENVEVLPFLSFSHQTMQAGPVIFALSPEQAEQFLIEKIDLLDHRQWAIVVCKNGPRPLTQSILMSPRVASVLDEDCSNDVMFSGFKSAITLLEQFKQQDAAKMLEDALEISLALMQEKDLDVLLGLILTYARKLIGADGASIYTRDQSGALYFMLWQNESTEIVASAQKTLVGKYSIAGYVAKVGKPVRVDDAYNILASEPYKFNPASDSSIGYYTKSILTIPLLNKADDVLGVLQLINKKSNKNAVIRSKEDCDRSVIPFDKESQLVAQALAGQASVALENSILYSDIEKLFEGFIKASVHAIEARDPSTAGHSFRVAEFTDRLAKAVDRSDQSELRNVRFSKDELKELRYAALLHDFGKVGVRENVLVKASKLYPYEVDIIKHKFQHARSHLGKQAIQDILNLYDKQSMTADELAEKRRAVGAALELELNRLKHFLDIILKANEPSVLHEDVSRELNAIAKYTIPGENGEPIRLLDDFEFTGLTVSKGSLTTEERKQIESHVSHTFEFLSLIPWTKNLANLPNIAHGHHEKLDGSGYPLGLRADDLPMQTRIMTISDIYDALTASDRPYKRALNPDKALDILKSEANAGKLDKQLFNVFLESKSYTLI